MRVRKRSMEYTPHYLRPATPFTPRRVLYGKNRRNTVVSLKGESEIDDLRIAVWALEKGRKSSEGNDLHRISKYK